MTQKIANPIPLFIDARGLLLDGGKIYIGVSNGDPETDPINVYWDKDLTILASQPLRTIGGRIVNGAAPASVFTDAADYSMRIKDSTDSQVDYSPSVFAVVTSFQTHSLNLDAIAAGTVTNFGVSLLGYANLAALASALGTDKALLLTGGTMTNDIKRQGGGVYSYWADSTMTSGRQFITAAGASDPTSQPGDIWYEKSA